MNTAIAVFVSLCLMLVVGKILRVNLPFLQRLYLPSSIVGGLVGLGVMCSAGDAVPAEFGQATGVTATGLMLLRTVNPENKTPAAMSFGYKQLLHEPFMGGGLWTALALTLVFQVGWLKVFWISLAMLSVWIAIAVVIVRRTDVKRERNGQKG